MSSIERAIDKLEGRSDAPRETVPSRVGAEIEPAGQTPRNKTSPNEAPRSDEALQREDRSSDVDAAEKAPSTTTGQGQPAKPARTVHLDFDRLALAGILNPGEHLSRQAEEFQRVKRRLLGNLVPGVYESSRPPNLILVTSSVPGEGKTFSSANLAISIAMEMDHTVLAVDTDILKRDLSKLFGVAERPGLYDLLADPGLQLADLLVRTNLPNLAVLPAGNVQTKMTEMLASARMQSLANEIAERYGDRVIIFDTPPIMAMTTVTALAPLVGQFVLVAEAGRTTHETIKEALHRVEGIPITGVILNKSKQNAGPQNHYYGYYNQVR